MKPIEYKQGPFDTIIEGDTLTESEHQDSCDINKMLLNASRGMDVRAGRANQYGYDDMTMDGLQFRIQKQDLEERLSSGQKEFTQEELDLIPKAIQEKFGFTLKKQVELQNEQNDDLTTKNSNPAPPIKVRKKTAPQTSNEQSEASEE